MAYPQEEESEEEEESEAEVEKLVAEMEGAKLT